MNGMNTHAQGSVSLAGLLEQANVYLGRCMKQAYAALPPGPCSLEDARAFFRKWTSSAGRMSLIVKINARMDRSEWLTLLGENWLRCQDLEERRADLRKLLGTAGPLLEMMSAEALEQYRALPREVVIYRACDAKRLKGLDWSLHGGDAERGLSELAGVVEDPVLVIAAVAKQRILALIPCGEGFKVVTFSEKRFCIAGLHADEAHKDRATRA